MKMKSIFRLLILSSLCVILYGCPPDLEITPSIVTKIVNEGGTNYCYVMVKNTSSTEECQFAIESPTQFLKIVDPPPINNRLQPLQTVELKYMILNTPTCPGTTPCQFDKIRVMGRWKNEEVHEEVPVQWSNPVTQGDCWLSDGGSNDGHYSGLLCNHLQPNNMSGGATPDYTKINDVTNPNSFPILVRINNTTDKQACLSLQNYDPGQSQDWVTILPFTSYSYAQTVIANFPGGGCSINPASMIVKSDNGTSFDGVTKWVKIRVSYK